MRGWLDRLGLSYEIDARLVRGLDYYTRTVFELMSNDLGAQDTLLGGGRYDGLIEMLGGPATPGIGFAGGYERLVIVLQENAKRKAEAALQVDRLDLFVAMLGDEGRTFGFELVESLRASGVAVDFDPRGRALRKQMSQADRLRRPLPRRGWRGRSRDPSRTAEGDGFRRRDRSDPQPGGSREDPSPRMPVRLQPLDPRKESPWMSA